MRTQAAQTEPYFKVQIYAHLRKTQGNGVTQLTDANVQVIDARGSFCPGPMMELIRAVKAAEVGQVISVLSNDSGSKKDIPKWAEKAGQEFVGIENHDGYDEITVRKVR